MHNEYKEMRTRVLENIDLLYDEIYCINGLEFSGRDELASMVCNLYSFSSLLNVGKVALDEKQFTLAYASGFFDGYLDGDKDRYFTCSPNNAYRGTYSRAYAYGGKTAKAKKSDSISITELVGVCGRVTKEKGFTPERQPRLQSLLIIDEVYELMESSIIEDCKDKSRDNDIIKGLVGGVSTAMEQLRILRTSKELKDSAYWLVSDNTGEEMADGVIRYASMCSALGIDLDKCIKEKIKKNKNRPILHGKKF